MHTGTGCSQEREREREREGERQGMEAEVVGDIIWTACIRCTQVQAIVAAPSM